MSSPAYRAAASDADRQFVRATWSSSYKNAHAAGMIASEDWPTVMHAQIDKVFARSGTRVIVACDARKQDFLFGHIVGDVTGAMPVVYYVYVKEPYRSQPRMSHEGGGRSGPRLARALFAALGVDPDREFAYACTTAVVSRLKPKIPRGRFIPATVRYANYNLQEHEA